MGNKLLLYRRERPEAYCTAGYDKRVLPEDL